jgi:hypothetical protein
VLWGWAFRLLAASAHKRRGANKSTTLERIEGNQASRIKR